MKNFKHILIAVFVSLTFVACKSDDDAGEDGDAGAGTVAAKVSGSNFTSNSDFTVATQTQGGGSTTVRVQGSDNSGKGIVLMIGGFEGTGTYEIGGGANIFVNASYVEANASNPQDSQAWQAPYDDTVAGEINVTEINETRVKGTFFFDAKNSNDDSVKMITEGSFDVEF